MPKPGDTKRVTVSAKRGRYIKSSNEEYKYVHKGGLITKIYVFEEGTTVYGYDKVALEFRWMFKECVIPTPKECAEYIGNYKPRAWWQFWKPKMVRIPKAIVK